VDPARGRCCRTSEGVIDKRPIPTRVACCPFPWPPCSALALPPVCQKTPTPTRRPGVEGPRLRLGRAPWREFTSRQHGLVPLRRGLGARAHPAGGRRPAPVPGLDRQSRAGRRRPGARHRGRPAARTRAVGADAGGAGVEGGAGRAFRGRRPARRARPGAAGTRRPYGVRPPKTGRCRTPTAHPVTSRSPCALTGVRGGHPRYVRNVSCAPADHRRRGARTPSTRPGVPAPYGALRTGLVRAVRLLRRSAHPPSSGRISGN
jgi:hypothetical protein